MKEHAWRRSLVGGRLVGAASILSTSLLDRSILAVTEAIDGPLLDVGCGNRPYRGAINVAAQFGVDYPPAAGTRTGADAHGTAVALPIRSGSISTVLCTEVLEHVDEPMEAVAEVARVLRAGGVLVASVPFVHELHEWPFDYYRFTPAALVHLLESNGLEIERCVPVGGAGAVLLDLGSRLIARRIRALGRVSHVLERLVQAVTVKVPQRVFVRLCLGVRTSPDARTGMPPLALGYVVRARKNPTRPVGGKS